MTEPIVDISFINQLAEDTDKAMLPEFFAMLQEDVKRRLNAMSEAIKISDFKALEVEAHTLASPVGSFGAKRFGAALKEIMQACKQEKFIEAAALTRILPALAEESLHAIQIHLSTL